MSSPIDSSQWMYSSGTSFYDHTIDQSLRLDHASGEYLTISSASPTATNRKKVAISCWVKRAGISVSGVNTVFWADSNGLMLQFFTADSMYIYDYMNGTNYQAYVQPDSGVSRLFRDTNQWMHIALIIDTTQGTAANRSKLYINGELNAQNSYPAQNDLVNWHTGSTMRIGSVGDSQDLMGYIAEFISIDGQDVSISDFGEAKDGIWVPKDVSGLTLGNAGFYLKFDNSSDIGNDSGANNIDFSATRISAHDVVPDSPTNNWCTFNPLAIDSSVGTTLTEGNLKVTPDGSGGFEAAIASFTLPRTGKWYWEYRTGAGGSSIYGRPSIITADEYYTQTTNSGEISGGSAASNPNGVLFTANDGGKRIGDSDTSFGSAVSANDIIGLAYNADTGQLYIYINNSIQASGAAISESIKGNLAGKDVFILHERYVGGGADVYNFGQDSTFAGAVTAQNNADGNGRGDFYYAPPSGYLALCSLNLSTPAIGPNQDAQADDNFNTVVYTGSGASQSITGVGFQPDWLWFKSRSHANPHEVIDSVRGVTKRLRPGTTNAESTASSGDGFASIDSDGFTLNDDGGGGQVNGSSRTYVAWNWKAATAFSNDASATSIGTIDSSGKVNTEAGFSIVIYEGSGANATIAHGLSAAPEFIVVKNRENSSGLWLVYHKAAASDAHTDYLHLEASTTLTDDNSGWNDTAPTSTVFSVGTSVASNQSGKDHVAYCFHSVEGYSKFGAYEGNANANGVFVHLGFKPAWLMCKNLDSAGSWIIFDNKREGYNFNNHHVMADTSATEADDSDIDLVSNGFKCRRSSTSFNSSESFVYIAFAETPYQFANAR